MAISNAVERDGMIYIYDENGRRTGVTSVDGTIVGVTSVAVSIKRNGMIYMYDENGRQTGAISAN